MAAWKRQWKRGWIVVLILELAACGSKVDDVDDAGGSEGSDDDDDDESGGDLIEDGTYVDCSSIPATDPTVGPGAPGPLGFPELACNPRQEEASAGSGYTCCSTDPATAGGLLPDYQSKNIPNAGTPLFSGINNDLGTWGMCVRTADIPTGSGLLEAEAENCPIPCNPTWEDGLVADVCGANRVCCQTTALQEADCFQGEDGLWRPVTGEDIGNGTTWAPGEHATHQDPSGTGCSAHADGDQSSDEFIECVRELSVADQRGYCMALQAGQVCPAANPTYVTACDLLNGG